MSQEKLDGMRTILIFEWRIKNFHMCHEREESHILSPRFTSSVLDNSEWMLYLHPKYGENIGVSVKCVKGLPLSSGMVELFIKKIDSTEITRHYKLSLLSEELRSLLHNRASVLNEDNIFLSEDTLTVGCRIKKMSETFQVEQWIAHTEIPTGKFSVTFPFHITGMQQLLTVPLTSVTDKYPDCKIFLDSYFHGPESLRIYITMDKSSSRIFAVCHLSVQDTEGAVKYLVEEERWLEANTDEEKWELKNSLPEKDKMTFYSNKTSVYTLFCKLSLTKGGSTTNIEKVICPSLPIESRKENLFDYSSLYSFKEKVGNLYKDRRLCDFTIHVGDKEFPVHKTVLGSVSPVLCAMLERDMKEKESSQLIIEDIDEDTVQRLIDFSYNEIVEDLEWDRAIKLFSAADKYEIFELKRFCLKFIIPNITLENVIEALMISDLHQDKNLEKAVKHFIFANSKQLFKMDGWKIFMESNMKMANEVMFEVLTLTEN